MIERAEGKVDPLLLALADQGLIYLDGKIVPIDSPAQVGFEDLGKVWDEEKINPSEFDKRLNALLKEFESLPKKEIASILDFYLKAVIHETPFNLMRLKEVAKPETPHEKGLAEFEEALKGIIKRHDGWMSSFDDDELKDDAKELLAIARKEFLDKACEWLTVHKGEEIGLFCARIEEFKKYTEEQQ